MTNWKHNPELWDFPCDFLFKVLGLATADLVDEVIAEIQKVVPGNYSPVVRPSNKGTYQSISVNIRLQSKEQLESLYAKVNGIPDVKVVL